MTLPQRPLAGCIVSLSISESDDSAERGFPSWQVNRVTLQLVAALFGQGASVVFGHDWREDGVMERSMASRARCNHLCPCRPSTLLRRRSLCCEICCRGRTSRFLPERDLEQLKSTLRVECVGLPRELRHSMKKPAIPNPTVPATGIFVPGA